MQERLRIAVAVLVVGVMVGCGSQEHTPAEPTIESMAPVSDKANRPREDAPAVARVLGSDVHAQDAEDLRYFVLRGLIDRFAAERSISVTQAEKDAYRADQQAFEQSERARDALRREELSRRLAEPGLSTPERASLEADLAAAEQLAAALSPPADEGPAERAEDEAARDEIAAAFVRQWKINRALYQQYGGRVAYQQGGPEPLDAYRQFLEESEKRGDFVILDEKLGAEFWRYYRDDSLHSFFPAGSPEEAAAFAEPPWLRETSVPNDR